MLDNAVYYSRRAKDEQALAEQCSDRRARDVHLLLAQKYSELAQRELAMLGSTEAASEASVDTGSSVRTFKPARSYR